MAPEKPYTCHAWADTCCESVFFFANVFVWAGIENCSVLAIDSSMYLTVDVEVHSRWMHHPCVIKQNLYNSFHIKTNNEQYCCLQEPSSSATLKVSQNSVHSSMTVSVTACDYQEIQCWGSLTAHSLYCNMCSGAQKNAPFRETTSQLLLCWHRVSWRGEQSSSQLWGEPPICIQNVARHRWQAERGGGHQRGRLLLCACRLPPSPHPAETPTPVEAEIQRSSQCGATVWTVMM